LGFCNKTNSSAYSIQISHSHLFASNWTLKKKHISSGIKLPAAKFGCNIFLMSRFVNSNFICIKLYTKTFAFHTPKTVTTSAAYLVHFQDYIGDGLMDIERTIIEYQSDVKNNSQQFPKYCGREYPKWVLAPQLREISLFLFYFFII
jgi:hypothetical protein